MIADKLGITIHIEDGLDLEKMAVSGQCFRWIRIGPLHYAIPHREHLLEIRQIREHHTGEHQFHLSCSEGEFQKTWRDYFDLDTDYNEIRSRVSAEEDEFLHRACQYGKGIRLLRQDPWEVLISFIISQNRNIPAIKRSIEILCERAGTPIGTVNGEMVYSFPAPLAIAGMSAEDLADCRLGYRDKYVAEAARAVACGQIDLQGLAKAGVCECEECLTSIYGVGKKVASCIMLYGLHQTDAFPVDVWVKRILENEYPDGYPFQRHTPCNGIYQQYMFDYYRRLQANT